MRQRNSDSFGKEGDHTQMLNTISQPSFSRRSLLKSAGAGFGHLALSGLLAQAAASEQNPLGPKPPHFPAKAKRIIFIFMEGAISTPDAFEYKPELQKNAGKTGPGGTSLTPSKFQFRQYGQTGS